MDLHRFENNPKVFFDPQPHTCDFFEIMIFQNASGVIELNGKSYNVEKNSFFFICPFQKKACKINQEGIQGFHLVFQNDFLSNFFNDKLFAYRLHYFFNSKYGQFLRLSDSDFKMIQFALNEIISEIHDYQNDSSHIIRSLLYYALSKLNRIYSLEFELPSNANIDSDILKFKELLEKKIREHHDVQYYSETLQISRQKLNGLTKTTAGCSSKELISNRLLQEVKTELIYSSKTVTEIAYELNFSEPNNLTRFFNKMEGVSPVAFRNKAQIDSDFF